jgi:hypothetical protein
MQDKDSQEQSLVVSGWSYEQMTCPFSHGSWEKTGDALVFIMLLITPLLFLIALIMSNA